MALTMLTLWLKVFNLKATFKGAPPIFFLSGKTSHSTSPKQTIFDIIL
ncbi:hypothetical protein JCM19302_774 [Jejuia pallidilutea]|uniref:Uncharacterized protein n=1 Tax=Jejuia pallidilutea TaxID=504487 RepID=A0A090W340_9FLAO|nr:hypothetical protein JCM19302_774 [Jejuia pallidilutea]GAL90906.1 hypothetical protein JCM19538_964 [Jejuia pallidilutea]